jgi:hypothetical protein
LADNLRCKKAIMPMQKLFAGTKRAAPLLLGLWIAFAATSMWAQQQPALPPLGQTLTPDQLEDRSGTHGMEKGRKFYGPVKAARYLGR